MTDENIQTFEELLEEAVSEVKKTIMERVKRTYFREPTAHDVSYHLGPDGRKVFYPNGIPIEASLNQAEPESIDDRMRRLIRSEALAREVQNQGLETFEEADDFDTGEPDLKYSPYEMEEHFDPPSSPPAASATSPAAEEPGGAQAEPVPPQAPLPPSTPS